MSAQVVGLLRDVWQTVGLDVYVDPYGVLPTKYECGIIQVGFLHRVLTLVGCIEQLLILCAQGVCWQRSAGVSQSLVGQHAAAFRSDLLLGCGEVMSLSTDCSVPAIGSPRRPDGGSA